jgi:uncharacterized protein YndB with AHSA1/START domain
MKTKTLHQTVKFKASPTQVYEMLMDSRKHRSLSGMPAKISRKVGGKFTAWGTHISGFNLALLPGSKIVQAWRATGWWPDHYSIAIFDIKKVPGGSRLEFTQIGVPPNRYSGHYRGWIEAYWTLCACAVREARNSSSLAAIAQNLRRLAKLVVRPPPVTEACFAQGA